MLAEDRKVLNVGGGTRRGRLREFQIKLKVTSLFCLVYDSFEVPSVGPLLVHLMCVLAASVQSASLMEEAGVKVTLLFYSDAYKWELSFLPLSLTSSSLCETLHPG